MLAQECRGLAEHESILAEFHPPFTGNDEYTAVLVRKSLSGAVNMSDAVREPLLEQLKVSTLSVQEYAHPAFCRASNTASISMAAGVTPGKRAAAPRVLGRAAASRSATSLEMPGA